MTRIPRGQIVFFVVVFVFGVGILRGGETCGGIGLPASARRQQDKLFSEESRFRAAEKLFQGRHYPQAADAYRQLLAAFPAGCHRKQVVSRLYEIAQYWLKDSWESVGQVSKFEERDWIVWLYPCDVSSNILPDTRTVFRRVFFRQNLIHRGRTKPFFNEEGRAVELLVCVYDCDPTGPLADKSLHLIGYLSWFREDYCEADKSFSRLVENHPSSPFVPYAIEMAVKAKLMAIGEEPANDSRRLAEARKLIYEVIRQQRDYPEARKRELIDLLKSISAQQASIAFKAAEACQLADQLERACTQYEALRDRYPATSYASRAEERLEVLKARRKNMSNAPSPSSISRR